MARRASAARTRPSTRSGSGAGARGGTSERTSCAAARSLQVGTLHPSLGRCAPAAARTMISTSNVVRAHRGNSMETTVFELVYYGLGAGLAAILLAVAVGGIRLRRSLPDRLRRTSALGLVLAAAGVEIALVSGVGLDQMRPITGDLLYQQVHFSIFYAGFALVLAGVDRVTSSAVASGPAV